MKLEDTFDLIRDLGYGRQLVRIQNAYGPKAIQNVLSYYRSSQMFSIISNLLLRSMAKAKHQVENIGHFGLGSKCYTHFTSPIRRYPDLFIHRIISKYLEKNYNIKNTDSEKYKTTADTNEAIIVVEKGSAGQLAVEAGE